MWVLGLILRSDNLHRIDLKLSNNNQLSIIKIQKLETTTTYVKI